MKPFKNAIVGNWTCPKCGNVYTITAQRFPARERGRIACECGQQIVSWSGTTDYSKEFVRKGDPKDAMHNPVFG